MSAKSNSKIYSRQFWLICCSSLMFFASFNMIVPELPDYLTSLGGASYKGLIISLFTVTALLSRPFSGKLADSIGRVPVVIIGSVVCLLCSLIYPVITSVTAFLWLRLVHGFSTGFTPTGQTAYLSDIIPSHRRGEAMGILGTAGTIGMAGGPAIGGLLANQFGLEFVFYASSAFAFISLVILSNVKETLREKQTFSVELLRVRKEDIFEPRVIVPCFVMVLTAYAYGCMFTIISDYGAHLGIRNKGLLFTYLTAASFAIRLIGGKASDKFGRRQILLLSTTLMCVSMIVTAFAESQIQLIIGIIMYGCSQGATSPTLLAWATDLSDEKFKARGLASLYIFMELGIGIGALASGMIYDNQSANFFMTFSISGTLALAAFLYLVVLSFRTRTVS